MKMKDKQMQREREDSIRAKSLQNDKKKAKICEKNRERYRRPMFNEDERALGEEVVEVARTENWIFCKQWKRKPLFNLI